MKKTALLPALLILLTSGAAYACSGGACKDVSVTFEGGCYYGQNNGGRTVKLTLGEGGIASVSTDLSPGERHRFTFFGDCFGSFVGETTAVYVD